jgi:hypothetical protein
MKTFGTISTVILATLASAAAIGLGSGLPLVFAVLVIVAAATLLFGASIAVGALVRPMRGPLSLAAARGQAVVARSVPRPISRPARVAA